MWGRFRAYAGVGALHGELLARVSRFKSQTKTLIDEQTTRVRGSTARISTEYILDIDLNSLETDINLQTARTLHMHIGMAQTGFYPSVLTMLEAQRLQAECDADRDRVSELTTFFRTHKNSVSNKTVLQSMPEDLRHWLTGECSNN